MAGDSDYKCLMRVLRVAVVLYGFALVGTVWGQEPGAKVEGPAVAPTLSAKQKKLLEDSEKLVTLAAELKVSVGKSSKNELSLDVVRKAEALEKLARSVKERMREAR